MKQLYTTINYKLKLILMENFIDINGKQVLNVTPDYNRPLALVDLNVLRMLTDLLPEADFSDIRNGLRKRIMDTDNLEDLVQICSDFTTFHESVNLIKELTSNEIFQNHVPIEKKIDDYTM